MDPHYPYIPPEEYLSVFSSRKEAFDYNLSANYTLPSKKEVEVFRKLYEGEVRYTDRCIGEFLQYLENRKLMEDSLILITGDHGHAFMEHGRFGHAYDILYNEVIHIPLIMFGLNDVGKIDAKVGLLDVPSTILDLMRIRKPKTFMGRTLLSIIDEGGERPIFSESAKPDLINVKYNLDEKVTSCILGSHKIILNDMKNSLEMYNIDRDFGEKRNIIDYEKEIASQLKNLIQQHVIKQKIFKMKLRFPKESYDSRDDLK